MHHLQFKLAIKALVTALLLWLAFQKVDIAAVSHWALVCTAARGDVLLPAGPLAAGSAAWAAVFLLALSPRRSRLEQWPLVRKFYTLSDDFRRLLVPTPRNMLSWFAALSQHLLRVAILAMLAAGLGLDVPVAALFAFTPAALLIAMVPISFGGWGVREVSFVYLLGTAGVSAEAALSLSVAFGLLRVVVGALGGIAWALMSDHHYRVDPPSA